MEFDVNNPQLSATFGLKRDISYYRIAKHRVLKIIEHCRHSTSYNVLCTYNVDKLADWFKANKLTLNISKTEYMIFKDNSKTVNFASHNLKIDNEVIERIGKNCPEESFKFVGINLDECLSWRHHVNHVRSDIAGATGCTI